ncbi:MULTISPECIES: peptidase inhibitor family I36 protein [Streptomyces]|uniref:Peptidase inhibitor family I36 protein n=1 Tax=Streptomyces decoyicus TaxID=249567 RepID=A0ABZ1F933_9ACTN|nr:peptidase inhibitor family I36 protein [Streptomyces decoyicus]WSB66837.1 peptidase inhibitor family I36 protein [Streptomyces decoyicus]WSV44686.1 peptidase inhibitor family I36 protein [Streptomyces decoyicus]
MRRIRSFAVAAAALAAALGTVPTASATPTESARAAAFSCTSGYFCIYSDWNGGGTRCQWSQSSKANTADDCSFIQRGQNVRSVWNSTRHRVQYYTQTNYHARVGSTPAGAGGNLQGSYQIRSFKPQ